MAATSPDPDEGARPDEPTGPFAADGGDGAGDGSGSPVPDDASGLDDLPPAPPEGGAPAGDVPADVSVEGLLDDVERLTAERDDYLDKWRRGQADFENSRKRLQREATDAATHATGRLAEDLLPVLDACDAAIGHGETSVEPIFAALLQVLEKNGLERIDPTGEVFDPTRHEAVMHEAPGPDDDPALSLVTEVLRIGYVWNGRVVRAAMVKVRG